MKQGASILFRVLVLLQGVLYNLENLEILGNLKMVLENLEISRN